MSRRLAYLVVLRVFGWLALPVPLITGEVLISYVGRLATANHLTLADVLATDPYTGAMSNFRVEERSITQGGHVLPRSMGAG